nr:hypothetical protein [Clostridia bacterium]
MSGTDLRIKKTYAALTRAFTDLLKTKCFEQITVKELCDAAIIRTATFYNHFSDKYEFADFIIRDMLQRYHRDSAKLSKLSGQAYYERLISDAFSLLENNTDLIRSLASDSMLWSISEVIRCSMHDELLEHLISDKASGQDLAAEPELLTEFIIGGLEQTLRWWFTSPDPVKPALLKKDMLCCILRLIS